MNRVIITGGAGFIGSHLVVALLAMGCEVMSFDCLLPQVHPQSPQWPEYQPSQEGLYLHFGDVRDPRAVVYALETFRPDTVIHLAAMVGVGQSQHDIARYTSANVTGTANLLQCILDYNKQARDRQAAFSEIEGAVPTPSPGQSQEEATILYQQRVSSELEALKEKGFATIQQVLVAGSMSSYGEGLYRWADGQVSKPDSERMIDEMMAGHFGICGPRDPEMLVMPVGTTEETSLQPASVYAWTKAQQEELALLVWRTRGQREGLSVQVARFFNAYGTNQSLTNPYTGAAAIFSARLLAGLPPIIFEDGGQLRDFTHVSDVASAVIAILDQGLPGETYNVCTGTPNSILAVAEFLCDGVKDADGNQIQPQVTGQYRVGDIRHCYGDSAKIRKLGWAPKVRLVQGLAELRQWVWSQPEELRAVLVGPVLDIANQQLLANNLILGGE